MSTTESALPKPGRKRKWVVLGSAMVVPITVIGWLSIPLASVPKPKRPPQQSAHTNAGDPNVAYRRLIVGEWQTFRDGKRHLKIADDGTAVMNVEIAGFAKQLAFGKQMRIDLEWSIDDGHVNMDCVGGEPSWAIKAFTTAFGTHRRQPILNLDAKQLLLQDDADDPDHDYKRIAKTPNLNASPGK